jgi:hypothetical protein
MRSFPKGRQPKVFNFETQNAIGIEGEQRFQKNYPTVVRKGLKECDFLLPDGTWAELKTDSRTALATGNYFMECVSNLQRNTPGGPWQAYGKGADHFVYQFACGFEAWFNCEALVQFLDSTEERWEPKQIANTAWSAAGYLVPITALEHLRYLGAPLCVK